jgi:hypothetical protein
MFPWFTGVYENSYQTMTEFEKLISDTKSPTENDIENLVNNFNRIVYDAADQSLKKMNGTRKRQINNKNKKCRSNNHQKWFLLKLCSLAH